jgi:hypothetical protein
MASQRPTVKFERRVPQRKMMLAAKAAIAAIGCARRSGMSDQSSGFGKNRIGAVTTAYTAQIISNHLDDTVTLTT